MNWGLEFGHGGWAAAAAAAAAAAFVWHAGKSAAPRALLVVRGLAVLAFILALLEPAFSRRAPVLARPALAVVVDHGHSMGGPAGRETRLSAAAAWLNRHRSRLEERADVSLYAAADGVRRLGGFTELSGLKPAQAAFAPGARDFAVLREGGAPPARAWLLSDGNAEGDDALPALSAALQSPVDALGVGPARRGRELSFARLTTPDFAFLHGRFLVETALEASGLSGESVTVSLLGEDPQTRGWTAVQRQTRRVAADYETLSASFTAAAQLLGAERFRLEASAGGAVLASREFRVEVIRQKYRIMFLAGRPSPEYAQLREFLKSDPNHELVSFVILRNPENPTVVPDNELSLIPFPADEIFVKSLSQFDLFILENFSYSRFRLPPAYLESLKRFVAGGGALLVIGGENAFSLGGYRGTGLEELLPVSLSASAPDFVTGLFAPRPVLREHPLVRLYDDAESSAAAWAALPPLDGWARFAAVKAGAAVLAVHPQEKTASGEPLPIVALKEHGRGKVMLVSTDSTWRWKLGSAADWRTASFYSRFWTRAVRYLTGSLDLSKVKFAPLPDRVPPREPAVFPLRVFDEGFRPAPPSETELSVVWTGPDGRSREALARRLEPGRYSVELTGLAPGEHRLRAVARLRGRPWGEDQARFRWEGAGAALPMNRRWLKEAAQAGGGVFEELASADIEALLARLPPVRTVSVTVNRFKPASSPFWLLLAAALFLLEWGLRRWKGYP